MSAEIIQFAPHQHKRDLETMTIKMAKQLIQFAKEGEPTACSGCEPGAPRQYCARTACIHAPDKDPA